jgi:hypothetical protein
MSDQPDRFNDCGCCEGLESKTPVRVSNVPALNAVAYRVGTHSLFKASMLAALSSFKLPGAHGLRTREDRDFSIALLDAWATVADVLSFYQERRANEHFLRTATERWSVRQLARLIGYRLKPGVAATTYLSFTIEESPGAPDQALKTTIVPVGTKVQSVPGPGEQPQTFETVEEIVARPAWNAIRPRLTQRHPIEPQADELLFEGLSTNLRLGDTLLLVPDDPSLSPKLRRVQDVTLETSDQRTRVRLSESSETLTLPKEPLQHMRKSYQQRRQTEFVKGLSASVDTTELLYAAGKQRVALADVYANLQVSQSPPPSVFVFRSSAALFGHNAPEWKALPFAQRIGEIGYQPDKNPPGYSRAVRGGLHAGRETTWADKNLSVYNSWKSFGNQVHLDAVYPPIVKGSWIVMKDGPTLCLYSVLKVTETSYSDFTLSAKVTQLELNSSDRFEQLTIRGTTVYAQSELLALARKPLIAPVEKSMIDLDGFVEGLYEGQTILVRGEDHDFHGRYLCERTQIRKVEVIPGDDGFVRITVETKLQHRYIRETVTIYANVALATHGERVSETLGSGDAAQSFQRLALRQPPLTYLSAATPGGRESTLRLYVNDVQWHEAGSFVEAQPDDHTFVVTHSEEGQTIVQAGDGKTGGRFPSGLDNVRAVYRKGEGHGGNVKAGQLSMLLTRPLGVKDAKNYTPAVGGDDGEQLDDARHHAPFTVRTLDRVVSLQDYEDFCMTFGGIAKALATWTWDGRSEGVFLTVAGPGGVAVDQPGELGRNLVDALRKAGDPHVPIRIASYRSAFFEVRPRVHIDPDWEGDRVVAEAEGRLTRAFAFEVRQFGQPVTLSEVVAVLQATPGVVAVDIDFFGKAPFPASTSSVLPERLIAQTPISRISAPEPAELLLLAPRKIIFGRMI